MKPEDETLPAADAGPVDCHVRPAANRAADLERAIASAWMRHAQRMHYQWPMGCGGHAALQTPMVMAELGFVHAVREVVNLMEIEHEHG